MGPRWWVEGNRVPEKAPTKVSEALAHPKPKPYTLNPKPPPPQRELHEPPGAASRETSGGGLREAEKGGRVSQRGPRQRVCRLVRPFLFRMLACIILNDCSISSHMKYLKMKAINGCPFGLGFWV